VASTLQRVLELWRESERQLAAQQPGSPERFALASQIERLRRLYQRISLHERDEIEGLKDPDRTIVRSEWLASRSRTAATRAEDALERSRTTRLHVSAAAPSPANTDPGEERAANAS
jgi:hypothetical protein